MKNLNLSFKTFVISATAFLVISLTGIVTQTSMHGKSQQIANLNAGMGTCFTRISQTFTSLMIADMSSNYLKPEFLTNTQECINVAAAEFANLWGQTFKEGSKHITLMQSEIHWFNEKVLKLKKTVEDGGATLTNSNIVTKFTQLEAAKNAFVDGLDKKNDHVKSWTTLWGTIAVLAFVAFIAIGTIFGINLQRNRKWFRLIEDDFSKAEEISAAKITVALDNIFHRLEMPKTQLAIEHYLTGLLEKQYDDKTVAIDSSAMMKSDTSKKETSKTTHQSSGADFQNALNATLDAVQNRAFTHGILIDADLNDDFNVAADQETLEQFLYNLLNYALDNSVIHNEGRKISLRSKPLGGTAYLKMSIANYCFNADELNFLNSHNATGEGLNVNLVLMKELIQDIGATFAVKNKMNREQGVEGSEIEIVFKRVFASTSEPIADKVVNIMKGSKKEILRAFNSEA
jgi:hypothetical protein